MRQHLPIFDTFKTKSAELTGEAQRQRAILKILFTQSSPVDRTRTGISKQIAQTNDIAWKNIYSGIFRDLDEALMPLKLVEEEGRLPLKRGPRALQEAGVPYYRLSTAGMIACLAFMEQVKGSVFLDVLKQKGAVEESIGPMLAKIEGFAPSFARLLVERHVRGYCSGDIDTLIPISASSLGRVAGADAMIQKEMLLGFMSESDKSRQKVIDFLGIIS